MSKKVNFLAESGISPESHDFLARSKMTEYEMIEYGIRLPIIMGTPYFMDQIVAHTPEIGFGEETALKTNKSNDNALMEVQTKRSSQRKFDASGLSFEQLSDLLNLSYCVTQRREGGLPKRNIASPGGLFPIDMYFINRRVKDLEKSVFFYNYDRSVVQNIAAHIESEDLNTNVERALLMNHSTDIDHSSVSGYIVLGATFNRVCFKYQDKGVRFALIDTGALIHAIYLACASLGIHCCAMGGYIDDELADIIGYDAEGQTVTAVIAIGKPL